MDAHYAKRAPNPLSSLAQNLALLLQKYPDLAGLIEAWPELPEPVKAGILAMIEASTKP